MNAVKIETLDYIVMTARFPTISIAAEKQFLSQTTLSSAIKSVENEVGFPIFERTPRGITLTAQGVEFVRLAEEVVQNYRKMLALASTPRFQRIRKIVATPSISFRYSVRLMQRYHEQLPGNCLSVLEKPADDILGLINEQEVDIGIGCVRVSDMDSYQKEAESANLVLEPLIQDQVGLYVGPESPFYLRNTVDISELKDAHFALSANNTGEYYDSKIYKIAPRFSILGNDGLVRKAVECTPMVALYISNGDTHDPFLEGGCLKKLEISSGNPFQPIQQYLIYRSNRKLNENDQLLFSCIRSTICAPKE